MTTRNKKLLCSFSEFAVIHDRHSGNWLPMIIALGSSSSLSNSSCTITTCVLAANSAAYSVTSPILINRGNVTLAGGSSDRNQTKIVRAPGFVDELIKIDAATPLSGIVLQNFTVCGGSNITPRNGAV